MAKRKTFEVEKLKAIVNIANMSIYGSKDQRDGANSLLEHVLHETGNYKGFKYLREEDLPTVDHDGKRIKPGIIFDHENHNHVYPDESRRMYY